MRLRSSPPPAARLPAPPAPAGSERDGYLGSSLDLRAGLEMRRLPVPQLPAEVLRELIRLRASWAAPAAPG
jgi:hypothetical protein